MSDERDNSNNSKQNEMLITSWKLIFRISFVTGANADVFPGRLSPPEKLVGYFVTGQYAVQSNFFQGPILSPVVIIELDW